MASLVIQMSEQQLLQLFGERLAPVIDVPAVDILREIQPSFDPEVVIASENVTNSLEEQGTADISPMVLDTTAEVDGYVRRCLGTVAELEAHQALGGSVLLGYPDGSVRELRLDMTQEGTRLPSPSTSRWRGRRRFLRHESPRAEA